ncbi:MAG: zinc-binding alcohol dehydrogenase [Bacteroidales bacterium]|nr:zinc-binding alcohol dehydrogenase [Bacteroidales bacterium]
MVYTYGPHAEYFKLDSTDRWHGVCVKVPSALAPDVASFTHMATIAFTSVRASNIELGDFVLVTGLGTIGNFAAQLAQLQGATVICTDVDDQRLEIAKNCGLLHVCNPTKVDLKAEIEKLAGEEGISTYIDASGATPVINASLPLVKLYGEVILLGSPRAPYQANLTDTFQKFHLLPHCLTMKGALEFSYPTHQDEFNKHSIERNAKIVMQLMVENKLKVKSLYSHKLNPAKAQEAYDGVRDKKNEFIGVVFDWTI